ncbi:hypothetical protein RRG08_032198 [Elysia crispata]|uniref:Uncharacterized protein n=1 Tax=Elysia crispata TaxID=231223 RepID=A0AAE1ABA1_9GAST|nr:hypothetical protein RRG08_032198 [Elysia crispata]
MKKYFPNNVTRPPSSLSHTHVINLFISDSWTASDTSKSNLDSSTTQQASTSAKLATRDSREDVLRGMRSDELMTSHHPCVSSWRMLAISGSSPLLQNPLVNSEKCLVTAQPRVQGLSGVRCRAVSNSLGYVHLVLPPLLSQTPSGVRHFPGVTARPGEINTEEGEDNVDFLALCERRELRHQCPGKVNRSGNQCVQQLTVRQQENVCAGAAGVTLR